MAKIVRNEKGMNRSRAFVENLKNHKNETKYEISATH